MKAKAKKKLPQYYLSRVEPNDCYRIFKLANDPLVRINSIHSEPIVYTKHKAWFFKKLESPGTTMYKMINEKKALVGQIRFDKEDDTFIIDYSVAKKFRGKGLGGLLVKKSIAAMAKKIKPLTLTAFVKPGNISSCKIFEHNNFSFIGKKKIKGIIMNKYILTLSD